MKAKHKFMHWLISNKSSWFGCMSKYRSHRALFQEGLKDDLKILQKLK